MSDSHTTIPVGKISDRPGADWPHEQEPHEPSHAAKLNWLRAGVSAPMTALFPQHWCY